MTKLQREARYLEQRKAYYEKRRADNKISDGETRTLEKYSRRLEEIKNAGAADFADQLLVTTP